MKYVALAIALFYGVVWLYGGFVYSEIGNARIYFFLGWAVLFAYLPFYWYRTKVEDPKVARQGVMAGATQPARQK
jgi:predicted secreted protein